MEGQLIATSGSEARNGDPAAHGEILALRKATASGQLRPGGTLYSTMEPCAMCLHAAAYAEISEIVFGCRRSVVGDAPYKNRLHLPTLAQDLVEPILVTHHGVHEPSIAELAVSFLSAEAS